MVSPEEAQMAARDLLRDRMSAISERRWCAGWYTGLQRILWREVQAYLAHNYALLDQDACQLGEARQLAYLAEVCGGWWMWDDEAGEEVFVHHDEWKKIYSGHQKDVPPVDITTSWVCPICGSGQLEVCYSERRIAPLDHSIDGCPWPTLAWDNDFVATPFDLSFACTACGREGITPQRSEKADYAVYETRDRG